MLAALHTHAAATAAVEAAIQQRPVSADTILAFFDGLEVRTTEDRACRTGVENLLSMARGRVLM